MVSLGFGGVADVAVDIIFTFPLPGLRRCVRWNLVLQGFAQAPSQAGKAVFACTHTCLDLAGLFVSSCPSEALEPFRVRYRQRRAKTLVSAFGGGGC